MNLEIMRLSRLCDISASDLNISALVKPVNIAKAIMKKRIWLFMNIDLKKLII